MFEKAFLQAVKKHTGIKKSIESKVLRVMERPIELGEPLKGNFRGLYSCLVKRNFIIIYILRNAKIHAANAGKTLTAVIEEGLLLVLSSPLRDSGKPVELPVSKASGVLPGGIFMG